MRSLRRDVGDWSPVMMARKCVCAFVVALALVLALGVEYLTTVEPVAPQVPPPMPVVEIALDATTGEPVLTLVGP